MRKYQRGVIPISRAALRGDRHSETHPGNTYIIEKLRGGGDSAAKNGSIVRLTGNEPHPPSITKPIEQKYNSGAK